MSGRAFKDLRPKMQRTGQWQDRLNGKNFAGETPDQAAKRRLADRDAEDAAELEEERAYDRAQRSIKQPQRSPVASSIARDERDEKKTDGDGEP